MVVVHHALPPRSVGRAGRGVEYGFLGLFGEGGEGCQVSQFVAGGPGGSLGVETSETSGTGIFSFHLGRVVTGGGGCEM